MHRDMRTVKETGFAATADVKLATCVFSSPLISTIKPAADHRWHARLGGMSWIQCRRGGALAQSKRRHVCSQRVQRHQVLVCDT